MKVILAACLVWIFNASVSQGENGAPVPPEKAVVSADGVFSPGLRLLFSGTQDVADTWGKLSFGVSVLEKVKVSQSFPFEIKYCHQRADGAWDVYGIKFTRGPDVSPMWDWKNSWKLMRAVTSDGSQFHDVETVFEAKPAAYTPNFAMAYNPDAGEYILLNVNVERGGGSIKAYFSPDGKTWGKYQDKGIFDDGDSLTVFWNPAIRRFICIGKTLQPYAKHLIDHGGTTPSLHNDSLRDRRVLVIRSSRDGRHWEPDVSFTDSLNTGGHKTAIPDRFLTVPDSDDPPDMEFYCGSAFWYHDRSYMTVLNYAANRLTPGKHGLQLDDEWWVSRDGLHWDRPWRGINALGDAFPAVPRLLTNPMFINGMILFPAGNFLLGVKEDRISYVSARANAEFSTRPFLMPGTGLRLNASIPSPERAFAADQAFVMAEVLDENGRVIPGYEKEKCLIRNADAIDLPLRWNGSAGQDLAGRKVSLRLYLRSANIYAVRSLPGR